MKVARKAPPPSIRHLRHWEAVCQFIDAEPYRSIFYPFQSVADPPNEAPAISSVLLERMQVFGLVHHRKVDCTWRLARDWRVRLDRLVRNLPEVEKPQISPLETRTFVANHGIDTLYVNLLAEELPVSLIRQLSEYKDQAQAVNNTVLTPWMFLDTPLNIFKSGKGTSGKQGVSWGYILRNELVEVKLRKVELSGIIGMIRIGAETLWRNGSKPSLDAMKRMLRVMWADPKEFRTVTYQLSQIHLCADIANLPLTPELLPRLVTHSLSKVIHIPDADEDDGVRPLSRYDDNDDPFLFDDPPEEWDEVAVELVTGADEEDWLDEDDDQGEEGDEDAEEDEEETPGWAEHGARFDLFGKTLSGLTFSPKSALSVAWYDKLREERKSGKEWMHPIHEKGGWRTGIPLTRIEPRFKRGVLRELSLALGDGRERWFDDPWEAIEHCAELWGFFAGLPPQADRAPDVTERGWMRLATPQVDVNKSRWPTDTVWEVVQSVPFGKGLPKLLKRVKRVDPALMPMLQQMYGLLKSVAVHRGSYLEGDADPWMELTYIGDCFQQFQQEQGVSFADEVRERARMMGKPLPRQLKTLFPKRPGRPKKVV